MSYRAHVTQVHIGSFSIPGLLLEDGNFAVAVPQLVDLGFVPPNRSLKQLQTLLGFSFPSHKSTSELNSKAVNVILLPDFERLLVEVAFKGNEKAKTLVRQLAGLSLQQLFSDAFGIKFEAEERQHWLTERQTTRKQHQPCVTYHWAKVDGISHGGEYAARTVFLKMAAGIPSNVKVDNMTTEQLRKWASAQQQYGNARELGLCHKKAVDFVKTKAVLV